MQRIKRLKGGLVFLLLAFNISVNTAFSQEADPEIIVVSCSWGARIEGSYSLCRDDTVTQSDLVHQQDGSLILLREDTLYYISLNVNTDTPSEIISTLKIPFYVNNNDVEHHSLLVSDNLIVVLSLQEGEAGEDVDMNFFSLSNDGEIQFKERYKVSDERFNTYAFMNSVTVVNNTLVAILPTLIEKEDDLFEQDFFNSFSVGYQAEGEVETEPMNIARSRKWANPYGALEQGQEYASVFTCLLDDVFDDGLQCDITSMLGANGESYYISDNSVYLWASYYSGGGYGVIAHTPYDYVQRTDHKTPIYSGEDNAAIYRIDIDQGDVTAVIVEGRPLNQFSFEEVGDSFSAIIRKSDEIELTNNLTYGLNFTLDQFSALPIALAQSNYQFLTTGEELINVNRFAPGMMALSRSIYNDESSNPYNLIVWDIENDEVISVDSEFNVKGLYFQNENLLTISDGYEQTLKVQLWSTGPEIQSLFYSEYPDLYTVGYGLDRYFLNNDDSQSIWGLPVFRMNDDGEPIEYKDAEGGNEVMVDIVYFETLSDASIEQRGKLKADPKVLADNCEVSCDEWYDVKRTFSVGDYVYALIDDEIIKGSLTTEGIQTHSRLHLISETVLPQE